METAKKALAIICGDWSEWADAQLARACVHATPGELKKQWQDGAKLYYVMAGEMCVGAYLLRRDGSEGVVIAAAGNGGGIDLLETILPVIEAQFSDCASIRIHTSRPGIIKKLTGAGYEAKEMVLAKVLT